MIFFPAENKILYFILGRMVPGQNQVETLTAYIDSNYVKYFIMFLIIQDQFRIKVLI